MSCKYYRDRITHNNRHGAVGIMDVKLVNIMDSTKLICQQVGCRRLSHDDKNYCKIHHPDAVKRRNEETDKRQQEKWDGRPFYNKAFVKNALDVQRSTDAEKARIYGQKNPEAFAYAQEIANEIEKED